MNAWTSFLTVVGQRTLQRQQVTHNKSPTTGAPHDALSQVAEQVRLWRGGLNFHGEETHVIEDHEPGMEQGMKS